ncbi:polyunsaturated fatty acid lipoxygenase ALOX15B-like [Corythoichthys intestinalis]|uniref:polyunsaturated fatty acid lipoxygenase ALOX15B-like n=1 Tax=Corythoichthys intestinalis TaxID=161448 RepID=UPI0025A5D72D|nr:polyunsaturated fatty acid lipoxygenase ALOX15B-like [Corythoichthys intestinalis]XP_061791769.1 polyunsaturated fatty acid lipoxygenase ALOX15B-like [Nerophis lumbriciformis]
MVDYEITIYTRNCFNATTFNSVHMKIVGVNGTSDCIPLNYLYILRGSVFTFTVSCPNSLGQLILIELVRRPNLLLPNDAWFPDKVKIKCHEGKHYTFPIYCWLNDSETRRFREGKALRIFDETSRDGKDARSNELAQRKVDYCWDVYAPGLPHTIKADGPTCLPPEVQFSFTKETEFAYTVITSLAELKLKGLVGNQENWKNLDHLKDVFWHKDTPLSVYASKHWEEDWFFAYQFLNGIHPTLIRRCSNLPENFPVTDGMVSMPKGTNLIEELKKGNIYLCDYKNLDGMPANIIKGIQQYFVAPLVLLHQTPNRLMPIAIQLKQNPAKDNPIFVPTDSKHDWQLAKTYVRSADFQEHQLNSHFLRTHLLAEVFAVSLLRNLPMVHPLYKLLVPHTRYTLQINVLARDRLIGPSGVFTLFAASGGKALREILAQSLSAVTYRSLCIPDDIDDRKMKDVPNFYYRDDGLKLWHIMFKFVQDIIQYYYKSDKEVKQDSELQMWVKDIFEHGFLSKPQSGIPQSFTTVPQLIKFVTMVMFTCSCQHAAVNTGQFDYCGWMPNSPSTLKCPPPTKKGTTSEATMFQTLPPIGVTAQGMAAVWLLSKQSSDFVPLGVYPEDHFSEETPCELLKVFKKELDELSDAINLRNKNLDIPYTYLDPKNIENSVSI